ncbi:MAG: DUF1499 domain-containing protein [Hyphomicrobiales bacterium]
MLYLVAFSFILGIIALLFFRSPETAWEIAFGDPDLGHVHFPTLKKTSKPNQFLVCPKDICKNETPDAEPPVYRMTKERLKASFIEALGTESRSTVDDAGDEYRFIMRSPTFRFPDTISAEFFDVKGGATLAIYARAQIGYKDFSVNEKRVRRWLSKLP